MLGTLKQITAALATLEQHLSELKQEFQDTYRGYLTALGKATRQQLIMASYQVCTEGYPEAFLRLSVGQRQDLQQALRQLAATAEADFLALLPVEGSEDTPIAESVSAGQEAPTQPVPSSEPVADQPREFDNELEFLLSAIHSKPKKAAPTPPANNLEWLIQWQERLEKTIADTLQTTSHAGNRLLQQARILPPHVPEPILEAATKSMSPEMIGGNPHVLKLLIESTEANGEDAPLPADILVGRPKDGATVLHLVAIHLRLSELEFTEPSLMVWRNRLRDLDQRLKGIAQSYQKTQREKSIAEAQVAWRSTWTSD
jgi:hypothetical protein